MTALCNRCNKKIKLNGGLVVFYLCEDCSTTGNVVQLYSKELIDMCDTKDNSLGIITDLNEDVLFYEIVRRILFNLEKFIIYFGRTESDAKLYLKRIIQEVESYRKIELKTSQEVYFDNCAVWCRARRSMIRGCTRGSDRPTLIIFDHINHENDSIVVKDALYSMILENGLPALQPQCLGGGKLIVLGNKNDNLIERLINNDNEHI